MAQQAFKAKPQPNIYTVLVIVAILFLGLTVGLVVKNLTDPVSQGGYGLEFKAIFDHSQLPDPVKVQPK